MRLLKSHSLKCEKTVENVIPAAWGPTASIGTTEILISGGGLKTGDIVAVQYGITQNKTTTHTLPANSMQRAGSSLSTQSTKKKRQIPTYTYGTDPIAWFPYVLFAVVQ
ncbi:MAG: hypothetical protein ACYDCN_02860 [Bacteroidia bacterium]